jgi:hypothetical protein
VVPMFKSIYRKYRQSTLFEKLLLVMGIGVGIIGFWLINTTFIKAPIVTWQFISTVFLWLLLIFVVILTDSNESIKEELGVIIREHIDETKLLKKEVVLLRKIMDKKNK